MCSSREEDSQQVDECHDGDVGLDVDVEVNACVDDDGDDAGAREAAVKSLDEGDEDKVKLSKDVHGNVGLNAGLQDDNEIDDDGRGDLSNRGDAWAGTATGKAGESGDADIDGGNNVDSGSGDNVSGDRDFERGVQGGDGGDDDGQEDVQGRGYGVIVALRNLALFLSRRRKREHAEGHEDQEERHDASVELHGELEERCCLEAILRLPSQYKFRPRFSVYFYLSE